MSIQTPRPRNGWKSPEERRGLGEYVTFGGIGAIGPPALAKASPAAEISKRIASATTGILGCSRSRACLKSVEVAGGVTVARVRPDVSGCRPRRCPLGGLRLGFAGGPGVIGEGCRRGRGVKRSWPWNRPGPFRRGSEGRHLRQG